MIIAKPYTPVAPKYPFTTETKTIYHVDWPDKIVIGAFTYLKKRGVKQGIIHRNSTPCMSYETIGYGPYREEITVDLEGNVHHRTPLDSTKD